MNEHGAKCEKCKHFIPARHESGRINRKIFGKCTYVVVWPKVPMTYGERWKPPQIRVWCDSNAEGCACYERADGDGGSLK